LQVVSLAGKIVYVRGAELIDGYRARLARHGKSRPDLSPTCRQVHLHFRKRSRDRIITPARMFLLRHTQNFHKRLLYLIHDKDVFGRDDTYRVFIAEIGKAIEKQAALEYNT